MKIVIKNGYVVDPDNQLQRQFDILIEDGIITMICPGIEVAGHQQIIDAMGMLVTPGLIDSHTHLREPGATHRETIRTGSLAAAKGGFTHIICEPNTFPPIDSSFRVKKFLELSKRDGVVHIYTKGAITVGRKGFRRTHIAELKEAGAVAISDDGDPVAGLRLMYNAVRSAKKCQIAVSPHCEESEAYRNRIIESNTRKNLLFPEIMPYAYKQLPYYCEPGFIRRDIRIAEKVGYPIHFSHVSLSVSVKLIREAKRKGIPVTAETTPHHFTLTEKVGKGIGPNAKVNPPLRSRQDVIAIKEGLIDGTIDIIATDHAPYAPYEKAVSWEDAPSGIIGLETALGMVFTQLVHPGLLTVTEAISKMTVNPAKIFGLDTGRLSVGHLADITIIDPDKIWVVDPSQFESKGRNCPFEGWKLKGKVVATIVAGKIVYCGREITSWHTCV